MRRALGASWAMSLVVALAACGGDGDARSAAPAPSTAPVSSTAPLTTITSQAQGLQISVPEDWQHRESLTPFKPGQEPICGSPEIDSFDSPTGDPCLFVGSLPRDGARSAEEWADSLRASGTATYDDVCDLPEEAGPATVDGQDAVLTARKCPGVGETHILVQVFTMTDDLGYVFGCVSDSAFAGDLDELTASCRSWVESARFLNE